MDPTHPTFTPRPHRSASAAVVAMAGLFLLALAVYWPARHFGFLTYDDQTYVWGNSHVEAGFAPGWLHYALTASFGGWAPVVWMSFLLDRQLFGATAGWMHLENVGWHAAGGVMLWLLLVQMTAAPWRSWVVAALFVVHPMHVESVAWVSERKDVLSTPLLLGAALAYVGYCRAGSAPGRVLSYGLMLPLFVLSLMTKAMGVTLPMLLLALDYWPLRRMPAVRSRGFTRLVIEKIPLAVVAVVFSVVSIKMQQGSGATDAGSVIPISDRAGNAIVCCMLYIAKLAVPTGLAAFYPHPGSRPPSAVIAAGGLLLLISWMAVRYRKTRPYLIVGWAWFLIALLPVIGLIQVGGQAMADRYSYLPSVGLFIGAVWGVGDLVSVATRAKPAPWHRSFSTGLAAAVLIAFAIVARQTVWYWKDTETLFTHCYQVTGPNSVAYYIVGGCALARGDRPAAAGFLTQAVDMDPGNDKALRLLGDACLFSDPARSVLSYRQAVDIKPDQVGYRIALAVALTRLNTIAALDEASAQLRQVLRLDPTNPQARDGLADLRVRKQKLQSRN